MHNTSTLRLCFSKNLASFHENAWYLKQMATHPITLGMKFLLSPLIKQLRQMLLKLAINFAGASLSWKLKKFCGEFFDLF